MTPKVARFAFTLGCALCAVESNALNAAPNEARAPTEPPACSTAVASVSDINARALFEGAVSCAQEGRQEDTNFLVIIGQIRALSDMTIFTPLTDDDSEKVTDLYGQLYFKFGGLGFEEFYRAPTNVSALEKRVRDADLRLDDGYDPGWSHRPSSKTDIYSEVLSNAREHRIWQMRNMALKLQDDEYYEAHQALNDLQRDNPVFEKGTPAFEEHSRLMARLEEADNDIPELPPPEDTLPYARLNEQDPELARRQVVSGFNGPASTDTHIFRSEAEVRQSWLAAALSGQQIETLLATTDFSRQVLVGFSFGKRMNASGQIMISELRYDDRGPGYTIVTRIGVVSESCGFSSSESYPFVIGVAEAVPDAEVRGYSTSNFPDECGPTASGKPATHH